MKFSLTRQAMFVVAMVLAPSAHAQAPTDGSVREKDIPIAVTEVAPGFFSSITIRSRTTHGWSPTKACW